MGSLSSHPGPRLRYFGSLLSNCGTILSLYWGFPGLSWGHPDPRVGHAGLIRGHHGNILNLLRGFLGPSLGPSWPTLRPTGSVLGLTWDQLEPVLGLSWVLFGAILTPSVDIVQTWSVLGPTWNHLDPVLALSWGLSGATFGPRLGYLRALLSNRGNISSLLLESSWALLGAIRSHVSAISEGS